MSLLSKLLGWVGGSPAEVPVTPVGVYRAPRKHVEVKPTPMPVLDVPVAHIVPVVQPALVEAPKPFSPVEPSTYASKRPEVPWSNMFMTGVDDKWHAPISGMICQSDLPAWTNAVSGSLAVYCAQTGQYQTVTSADNRSIIRPDLLDKLMPHERAQLLAFFQAAQARSHSHYPVCVSG